MFSGAHSPFCVFYGKCRCVIHNGRVHTQIAFQHLGIGIVLGISHVILPECSCSKMIELYKANVDFPYQLTLPTASIINEKACTEDPEELLAYLSEVGHPVLGMEPFDM